jgi:RNA polymerase-binding transcription factor
MKSAERQQFKRILRGLLVEVERSPQQRDEIAVDNAPDSLDRVQQATARDLAIRRIESNFCRRQSIELALARIEDGSYGTCLECEEDISPKRLQAVPWATHCIRCQNLADGQRKEAGGEHLDLVLPTAHVA